MTRKILVLAFIGGILVPAIGLTCTDIVVGKEALNIFTVSLTIGWT